MSERDAGAEAWRGAARRAEALMAAAARAEGEAGNVEIESAIDACIAVLRASAPETYWVEPEHGRD